MTYRDCIHTWNEFTCRATWIHSPRSIVEWDLKEVEVLMRHGRPVIKPEGDKWAGFVVKGYPLWNAIDRQGPQ